MTEDNLIFLCHFFASKVSIFFNGTRMKKLKMRIPNLYQWFLIIILISLATGIYVIFYHNAVLNDNENPLKHEISQNTHKVDKEEIQQIPNNKLVEKSFDSYTRRQQIKALWESFTQPTDLEQSYYSRGPGRAMVDINNLRNLTNPDSRELYLGVNIAYFCELISSNGLEYGAPANYYESSLYSLQIYCGDQVLSQNESNDLGVAKIG